MQVTDGFTELEKINTEFFHRLQSSFFKSEKNSSIKERLKKLNKLKEWIINHQDEILLALQKDLGKPEVEAKLMDIKPVLWEIDLACKKLKSWTKPVSGKFSLLYLGTSSKTLYEPLGVVLILSPWNFPFNLSIGPLVSAIAAGNNVVIKPSEISIETSQVIKKMIQELFSPEEIYVATGDAGVAQKLLKLPFNHIFFTGSPAIGKKVMEAASKNLSSVTLELGGCNPAIIDDTADIKDSVQKIVYGKFLNAGQSCLSVNTIYVDKKIEKELVKALVAEIHYRYFNSDDKAIASIINTHHLNRILNLIEKSKEMGAVEITERNLDHENNFLSPIVLTSVQENFPVVQEEIFGPVLPIISYDNINNTLKELQKKQSPLALYIFSKSKNTINKIIQNTHSGTICINETTLQFGKNDLPFGGINNSGIGKSHGHHGFLAFSNQRALLKQRIGFTLPKLLYPPYTKKIKNIANLLFNYF